MDSTQMFKMASKGVHRGNHILLFPTTAWKGFNLINLVEESRRFHLNSTKPTHLLVHSKRNSLMPFVWISGIWLALDYFKDPIPNVHNWLLTYHNLQTPNFLKNHVDCVGARSRASAPSVRRKQRLSDQYEINVPTLHLITFKYCTAHFEATKTLKYDSGNCKSIKKLSHQWFLNLLPVFFLTSRCNHNKNTCIIVKISWYYLAQNIGSTYFCTKPQHWIFHHTNQQSIVYTFFQGEKKWMA